MDYRGHSAAACLETIGAIALLPAYSASAVGLLLVYIVLVSGLLRRLSNSTIVLPTAYTLNVPFQCSPLQY